MSVLPGKEHTPSPGSLKTHNKTDKTLKQIDQKLIKTKAFALLFCLFNRHRFRLPEKWLTSTCIQRLCFLQTSAMRSSGSKAPCTVVPDVQLTKTGTAPWSEESEYAIPSDGVALIVAGCTKCMSVIVSYTPNSEPIPMILKAQHHTLDMHMLSLSKCNLPEIVLALSFHPGPPESYDL